MKAMQSNRARYLTITLAGGALGTILLVGAGAIEETPVTMTSFKNPGGKLRTYSTAGAIDRAHPFFNPLGKEQLGKIIGMLLKSVEKLLAERQITLELTPAAEELILREGYDPAYGARPLRRTIQRMIQDPLAMQILEGKVLPGEHVRVDRNGKKDAVRFASAAKQPAAAARI